MLFPASLICSYEPVRFLTLQEGINLIHEYKGLAFVAHPWLCVNPLAVCSSAAELGIDGLECFPPKHREEYNTPVFRDFAHQHSLLCSSGSDYHGINDLEVPIGDNVFPAEEVDAFLTALKKHDVL